MRECTNRGDRSFLGIIKNECEKTSIYIIYSGNIISSSNHSLGGFCVEYKVETGILGMEGADEVEKKLPPFI